jgi:hypothetical protein
MPTFGRETIRRFSSNVSGLNKMAARDFEDILQVCSYLQVEHESQFTNAVCNTGV